MNLAFDKKKQLVSSKLKQGSSKTLYAVVDELIDNKKQAVLPKAESDASLANKFQILFNDKIKKIRSSFTPSSSYTAKTKQALLQKLSVLEPTNVDEISNTVKSFGIKCPPDDPVPANLLSSEYETFIVNLSLETGSMDGLKNAVVIPLIKELTALTDTVNFKNYRPVSNLMFVSKLIERVVDIRLREQLVRNTFLSEKNYGYGKQHSTELLLL